MEIMCLVCPHVFFDERPVQVMIHYGDGSWQAVCGQSDHSEKCEDFRVLGVNHLFDRQSDLTRLATLPSGWVAEWTGGRWAKSAFDEDDPD